MSKRLSTNFISKEIKDLINYSFAMTDSTDRYPKKVRFTFTNRIQNLVLDMYSKVLDVDAADTKNKKAILLSIQKDLKMLSFLIEMSIERQMINLDQGGTWGGKIVNVECCLIDYTRQL